MTMCLYFLGIQSHTVSLEEQSANVVAKPGLEFGTVLEKLKKTGKVIQGAEVDGVKVDI